MMTPARIGIGWLLLAGWLVAWGGQAQTLVTPMMGGGQVAANMVHIDIYYDAEANRLQAQVDDSYGIPLLTPLEPGYAFDPDQPFGVLNGKAYNAQYGWNVGGLFALPAGAAIWIEPLDRSPGLEVYSGWGRLSSYLPLLGTAGSAALWKWSGVMVHNTYAVLNPLSDRLFADYHLYFGDAETGSRSGWETFGDTTVRLEWRVTPPANPITFHYGATAETNGAPLCFLNADQFETNTWAVISCPLTKVGPGAGWFECPLVVRAVAATAACGGPVAQHAGLGTRVEMELVSLAGPDCASLSFFESGQTVAGVQLGTGERAGTRRILVSENQGVAGSDPFGAIGGRHWVLTKPGLYCLGFRLVDSSTNGPSGGPWHSPSPVYHVYLQAGLTLAALSRQGSSATALFGSEAGHTYYLERSSGLGPAAAWQVVAGPLAGTGRLQTLTASDLPMPSCFFRLRAE